MSERITLPPGCAGFTTADGRTLKAKPGSTITLEDGDAARLMKSQHASIGLVSKAAYRLGTRDGRWCTACRRLWQGWSFECPKCGAATEAEDTVLSLSLLSLGCSPAFSAVVCTRLPRHCRTQLQCFSAV